MRAPLTGKMLRQLVAAELQARLISRDQFTAYDVTVALRGRLPHMEIAHMRVRTLVHRYMRGIITAGHYQTSTASFRGKTAIVYEPAVATMQPGIPGIPPLPLN